MANPTTDDEISASGGSRSLRHSALFSTGGIIVQGVVRLVFTVAIGRAFGAANLGPISALLSLAIFAALFWPTAIGNTASRFLALAARQQVSDSHVLRSLKRTFWLSCVVLALAAIPTGLALGADLISSVFGGWLVASYAGYAFVRGTTLGRLQATRVGLWDAISALATAVALLAILLQPLSSIALIPMCVGYTIFSIALWPRARPGEREHPTLGMMSFARWNVAAGLATNGLLQLVMLAAQVYEPGHPAGLFAAAFSLATPASMLGQAASQVIIPHFAKEITGAPLRSPGAAKLMLGFSTLALVLFGALALVAPWLVPLLYGAAFVASVPFLQLLLIGVFVFTVALIPSALMLASGHSRAVALASAAGFVLGLAVILLLGPSSGVYAGIWGFYAGSAVTLVLLFVLGLTEGRLASRLEGKHPLPEERDLLG
jgi:O-antigen/teichoic acid export membrane protein